MPPGDHYSHWSNGSRGVMVEQRGQLFIEYSYGEQVKRVPYYAHEWRRLASELPNFSKMQVAHVAHAADSIMSRYMGQAGVKREWSLLTDREKLDFAEHGPKTEDLLRLAVYDTLKQAMTNARD